MDESVYLEEQLKLIKSLIDEAYDVTKDKYDEESVNAAMANFFLYYKVNGFTRDKGCRAKS